MDDPPPVLRTPEVSDPEWPNVLTHGVGLVAAIIGTVVLIVMAARTRDPWQIVAVSVFGASMIILYAASTAYHAASDPRTKARLKVVDHAAIYLLIAGTYTPFVVGELRGAWGWSLFGVIWGLAVAGTVFKLFFTGRFNVLSTLIYVGMGWLVLVAAGPISKALPGTTLTLLVVGGVAYTAGTPFYLWERLRYNHALWHLFVLGATACHAVAVGTLLG